MSKTLEALSTIRDIIRYAVSRFNENKLHFGHGSDNAFDEAVYLTLSALHLPLDELDAFIDAKLLPAEKVACIELIKKRVKKRIPIAYLTGEAWLQGHRFIVDKNVIIPRSPIAELIVQQLNPWVPDPETELTILDLCTGSGNLAILAAFSFPHAQIDAADISNKALTVARQNIALHHRQHQIDVYKSNLFDQLPKKTYDIIICNPPYVNTLSMQSLPQEYQYEPKDALAGGEDGMDVIRHIVHAAPSYLNDNGFMILEIGHEYENFLTAFPSINPTFLETETTSESIVLLSKEDLRMLD